MANNSLHPPEDSITGHRVLAPFVTWIPGIFGSLANIVAIIICYRRFRKNTNSGQRVSSLNQQNGNRLHATPSFILCQLALADLIGTIYTIAIAGVDVYLDRQALGRKDINFLNKLYQQWAQSSFCGVLRFIYCVSTISSALFAILLAVERSKLILHYRALSWQDYRTTIQGITFMIWTVAIIIACLVTVLVYVLPKPTFYPGYEANYLCIYMNNTPDVLFYSAISYCTYCFISYSLIIIIYTHMILTLGCCKQSTTSPKIKPWLLYFAITIAIVDAVSWLPLSLAVLLQSLQKKQLVISFEHISVLIILAQRVNLAIHPFIYSSPVNNVNNIILHP